MFVVRAELGCGCWEITPKSIKVPLKIWWSETYKSKTQELKQRVMKGYFVDKIIFTDVDVVICSFKNANKVFFAVKKKSLTFIF